MIAGKKELPRNNSVEEKDTIVRKDKKRKEEKTCSE
jgi:hypothetical protein